MNNADTLPSITLYYREGSSDKVYQCAIVPDNGGFLVTFAYGRRGSALKSGTKTAAPVSLEQATKIYNSLVKEKTGKGYAAGDEVSAPAQASGERAPFSAQLLNPIEEEDARELLTDNAWAMQEKHDGERLGVWVENGRVAAANKRGVSRGCPAPVEQSLRELGVECVLDGEVVGDVLVAFDILKLKGADLSPLPYGKRLALLYSLPLSGGIKAVETFTGTADKTAAFNRLRDGGAEGVVFKRLAATHTPGRPASGGDQRKFKFHAEASVRVAAVNPGKRSVAIEVLDEQGEWQNVGNVTIPANHAIPSPGAIAEVRYLYAFKGGSLYQPVFKGVRGDVEPDECLITQLKYKTGT